MTVTIEVDDRLVASVERHLATQLRHEADPDTGAQRVVPVFPGGAREFLGDVVHQTVHQLVMQHPPEHLREFFASRRKTEEALKAATKPTVVAG